MANDAQGRALVVGVRGCHGSGYRGLHGWGNQEKMVGEEMEELEGLRRQVSRFT